MNSFVEEYAQKLYTRSLMDGNALLPYESFYNLINEVVQVIDNNPDLDISEYRNLLFGASGIATAIKELVDMKMLTPGLVISYGTTSYKETIAYGNKSEVPTLSAMTSDSIIDLASVTKLFTSISILKLVSQNIISLTDEVTKYCPYFKNLKGVTIFDLLAFQKPLITNSRIDDAKDKEEAESILFNMRVNENFNPFANPYTDMGAMVLKYVIEQSTGLKYYDYLEKYILAPLGLKDTYSHIPLDKLSRVVSTDNSFKMLSDTDIRVRNVETGTPYDEKASIFSIEGDLTGHAGLFSTASDLSILATSIIKGTILSEEYVKEISKNRTGKVYYDESGNMKSIQYLGYLCYSKNVIQSSSEILHLLSSGAFASPGWVGNQFVIDPQNEIFSFLGANRCHNRLVYIPQKIKEAYTETEGLKTYINIPGYGRKIDASLYAWSRGEVADRAVILALQYKALEEYLNILENNISLERII